MLDKEEIKKLFLEEIHQLGIDNDQSSIMKGSCLSFHISAQDILNIIQNIENFCKEKNCSISYGIEHNTVFKDFIDDIKIKPIYLN